MSAPQPKMREGEYFTYTLIGFSPSLYMEGAGEWGRESQMAD